MSNRNPALGLLMFMALMVFLLSGCEGGISGTGDGSEHEMMAADDSATPEGVAGGDASNAIGSQFLPEIIVPQIPKPLLVPDPQPLIPDQSSAVSALGSRLSQLALFDLDIRYDLLLLDGLFAGIEASCQGFSVGETCQVPDAIEGTVSEVQAQYWLELQSEYLRRTVDDKLALNAALAEKQQEAQTRQGHSVVLSNVQWMTRNSAPYSDELNVNLVENQQLRTLRIQWHRSGAPVYVTEQYRQSGEDISIQILFESLPDGNLGTVRYSITSSEANEVFMASLKQQPRFGEGLLATAEWSGNAQLSRHLYRWETLANHQGGYLRAIKAHDPDAENYDHFSRGKYNAEGSGFEIEVCNENGVDARCTDDSLWVSADSNGAAGDPAVLTANDLADSVAAANFTFVSVTGIPDTVRTVVVVPDNVEPPFAPQDILCSGSDEGTDLRRLRCWLDERVLNEPSVVYSEMLTGAGVVYRLIPTAQIKR